MGQHSATARERPLIDNVEWLLHVGQRELNRAQIAGRSSSPLAAEYAADGRRLLEVAHELEDRRRDVGILRSRIHDYREANRSLRVVLRGVRSSLELVDRALEVTIAGGDRR